LLVSPAYNIGLTTVANFWFHLLFLLASSVVCEEEQIVFTAADLREDKGKARTAPVSTQSWGFLGKTPWE